MIITINISSKSSGAKKIKQNASIQTKQHLITLLQRINDGFSAMRYIKREVYVRNLIDLLIITNNEINASMAKCYFILN